MNEKKFTTLDLKAVSEEGEFEGYASIFGVQDQGGDVVEKGAFKNSLSLRKANGIKMLFQHSPSEPIGMWTDISEDKKGLKVKGKLLTKVNRAAEVLELMRAGVLEGLSIGFRTIKAMRDDMTGVRFLKEVDLWEISVVTFPMLPVATITNVKNVSKRDVESILREAGVPNEFAKMVAIHGVEEAKTRLGRREADGMGELAESIRRATAAMKG